VRVLVLGGTLFVGRAVVEAALDSGHEVTLFHRGETGTELFPEVERVLGDRERGLDELAGREFDAVVDTSGYVPRVVAQACAALAEVGRYCFVSSVSAYAEDATHFDEETGPVDPEPDSEDVQAHYGALKAACERVVRGAFGDRALVIRPGLIVGPHDPTDRFTYWVRRFDRGGEVLAPAPPERQVQFIDVRDLADWTVRALEDGLASTYNATGEPTTLGAVLDACAEAAGRAAEVRWIDEALLVEAGVEPYTELPLWIPDGGDPYGRFGRTPNARAVAAGLTLRPLAETVRATLEWARTTPVVSGSRVVGPGGLAPEREAELLRQAAAR
jgi:2'-hydroxyisoflavone reductase